MNRRMLVFPPFFSGWHLFQPQWPMVHPPRSMTRRLALRKAARNGITSVTFLATPHRTVSRVDSGRSLA
jgi:hypothetical protein